MRTRCSGRMFDLETKKNSAVASCMAIELSGFGRISSGNIRQGA